MLTADEQWRNDSRTMELADGHSHAFDLTLSLKHPPALLPGILLKAKQLAHTWFLGADPLPLLRLRDDDRWKAVLKRILTPFHPIDRL
jgi:hypothetical protein